MTCNFTKLEQTEICAFICHIVWPKMQKPHLIVLDSSFKMLDLVLNWFSPEEYQPLKKFIEGSTVYEGCFKFSATFVFGDFGKSFQIAIRVLIFC